MAVITTRLEIPQQRQAHESPVIFYSCVLGAIGPVLVIAVPPVRSYFGYKPAERIPTSFPREPVCLLCPCVCLFTCCSSLQSQTDPVDRCTDMRMSKRD